MKEQPSCDIKGELMDKSFDYFVEHGLESTSLRDLCKGIRVSSGSMYYWFSNKDDIVISTAQHALGKIVDEIFEKLFEKFEDSTALFDNLLELVSNEKNKLRFIYQVATSPVYGERLRKKSLDLHSSYAEYSAKLAKMFGIPDEVMLPIMHLIISTVLDYVVWDEYDVTKIQLDAIKSYIMIWAEKKK